MTQAQHNQAHHQTVQRDRAVRRSGRVRAALVGGATAASVGIAGVLGLTALAASSGASATPAQQPAGASQPQKASLVADLKTFASGQQVSNGSGPSHATTKGS